MHGDRDGDLRFDSDRLLLVPEPPPELPLPLDEVPDLGHGPVPGGPGDVGLGEGAVGDAPLLVLMEGPDEGSIGGLFS